MPTRTWNQEERAVISFLRARQVWFHRAAAGVAAAYGPEGGSTAAAYAYADFGQRSSLSGSWYTRASAGFAG
jgi:hypothetical protein